MNRRDYATIIEIIRTKFRVIFDQNNTFYIVVSLYKIFIAYLSIPFGPWIPVTDMNYLQILNDNEKKRAFLLIFPFKSHFDSFRITV